MNVEGVLILALFGIWATAAGAFVAWGRDHDAKVVRKERWPWMYLVYVREGAAGALVAVMGLPVLLAVAVFYCFMFILGPAMVLGGIIGSGPSPAGRVGLILGGAAIASVFTFANIKFVKDWWVEQREEDRREKARKKREEEEKMAGPAVVDEPTRERPGEVVPPPVIPAEGSGNATSIDCESKVKAALEEVPGLLDDVIVKNVTMVDGTLMIHLATPKSATGDMIVQAMNEMAAAVYRRVFTQTSLLVPTQVSFSGGLADPTGGLVPPDVRTGIYLIRPNEIKEIDWEDLSGVLYDPNWSNFRIMLHPSVNEDEQFTV